jgi:hypothetical protein
MLLGHQKRSKKAGTGRQNGSSKYWVIENVQRRLLEWVILQHVQERLGRVVRNGSLETGGRQKLVDEIVQRRRERVVRMGR